MMHAYSQALPFRIVAISTLLWALPVVAQTPPSIAPPAESAPPTEQKYERILIEDGGSKIEETRLGGVTRSITVESKLGGVPYEVVPANGSRNVEPGWNNARDSQGKARWQIGTF